MALAMVRASGHLRLVRRRPGRRCVVLVATIRGLRRLELNTLLLLAVWRPVVALVVAVVRVIVGGLGGRRVRRRGLVVLVVAVVWLLRGIVALVAGEPSGAVEGLTAGLAAAAGGEARADEEEEEEAEDDEAHNEPADPVVPGRACAAISAVAIIPTLVPIIVIIYVSRLQGCHLGKMQTNGRAVT